MEGLTAGCVSGETVV